MLISIVIKLVAAGAGVLAAYLAAKGKTAEAAAVGAAAGVVLSETKPLVKGRKK